MASICCKIITITSIQIACANPPVTRVIIAEIATANIAPKYGIRLSNPIKKPNNTAYFTPNKDIAIDVNIPTTIPSNTWLDKNLKKYSFELLKYLIISSAVLGLNTAIINFFNAFTNFPLAANTYTETTIATNIFNKLVAKLNIPDI